LKYEYTIKSDHMKYPEDAVSLDSVDFYFEHIYDMAEAAAETEYNLNPKTSWPKTFEIFKNGKSLGSVVIDIERVPIFRCKPEAIH